MVIASPERAKQSLKRLRLPRYARNDKVKAFITFVLLNFN